MSEKECIHPEIECKYQSYTGSSQYPNEGHKWFCNYHREMSVSRTYHDVEEYYLPDLKCRECDKIIYGTYISNKNNEVMCEECYNDLEITIKKDEPREEVSR